MLQVRFSDLTLALAWSLGVGLAQAQPSAVFQTVSPSQNSAPAATLLVQSYMQAEQALQNALRDHQVKSLNALVASDFQLKTADGLFKDRSAWADGETVRMLTSNQFTVQRVESVDVVSFIQINAATMKKRWIVDLWQSGDPPILILRHESEWMPMGRPLKNSPTGIPLNPRPDGKG
jgi:hypothetical protein